MLNVFPIIQELYYVTELYQSAMTFGFDLSGKSLRCVANVPGSNFTAVSTHIIASFNSCEMPFPFHYVNELNSFLQFTVMLCIAYVYMCTCIFVGIVISLTINVQSKV